MAIKQPLSVSDELIDLVYQGPLETRPWQSFLHCLRVRLDCDTAGIGIKSDKNGPGPLQIWDTRTSVTDAEAIKSVKEHACMLHLDPLANALNQSGFIYTIDDVMPRHELLNSEYYKTLLKRYNVEYALSMRFSEPTGWKCQVNLNNGPGTQNFGQEHKEFLIGLRPHLERSLALYARLKSCETEKEILEEALGRLGIGVLILDGNGRVIDANGVARRIVGGSACLSLIDDRIVLTKPEHRARFDRFLNQALAQRETGSAGAFAEVFRLESPETTSLDILIRSIVSPDPYRSDRCPSVIVYVVDPGQQQLAPERFVAQLFGLTRTEAFLASLLALGFTLTESAEKLDVTESTVRTYAKRVYAKTGVRRQAELVRLMLKSVAALA